jgi:hypothetical protein
MPDDPIGGSDGGEGGIGDGGEAAGAGSIDGRHLLLIAPGPVSEKPWLVASPKGVPGDLGRSQYGRPRQARRHLG